MKINAKKLWQGFLAWGKEFIRKFLVALKRNPQYIPFASLMLSFLIFSLNLTDISNTTARIQGTHMGLCIFVSMLLSILSMICMLNAFPKRKKPNYPIIALMLLLFAVIIFVDAVYYGRVTTAITAANSPIKITESTMFILTARRVVVAHIVTVAITVVLTALEPLFARLLKKVNTSVEVAEGAHIDSIDLEEE